MPLLNTFIFIALHSFKHSARDACSSRALASNLAAGLKGSICQSWVVNWASSSRADDDIVCTCTPCFLWINTIMQGMKSGSFRALEPGQLGFNCKVNKCSDIGTGNLGVLPIREAWTTEFLHRWCRLSQPWENAVPRTIKFVCLFQWRM